MRLTPLRRTLFAFVVIGAVIAGASCDLIFTLDPHPLLNTFFEGCFEGSITDPPGGGKLKVIVEVDPAANLVMLSGCLDMALAAGEELATFTGNVEDENTIATLMAVRTAGGEPFTFRITRQPAGEVVATTIDASNFSNAPFVLAPGMARCAQPTTCADLGLALPFMPGGGGP